MPAPTAREKRVAGLTAGLASLPAARGLALEALAPGRYRIGPGRDTYTGVVPWLVERGGRLGTLVATDERAGGGGFLLRAIVLFDRDGFLVEVAEVCSAKLPVLTSITQHVPAAHWQEREVSEMFGFELTEHPEPHRRLLHEHTAWNHHPLRKDVPAGTPVPTGTGAPPPFRSVRGAGLHEIPVGPIHAGIIEPGHFRFHVLGERILHLQIRLGWQHKGIEKLFEGLTPEAGVRVAERISGDTTFGHALAYCRAIEDLATTSVPPRAIFLRAVALELERLANHVGDLGGLSADVGYAFGAAHFGRLRGEFLNAAERFSGNRYLRGLCCPGGVQFDLDPRMVLALRAWIERVRADYEDVARLVFASRTAMSRMDEVGVLEKKEARAFGIVGPPARAAGLAFDVRRDFAAAPYPILGFVPVIETGGDVAARARVRHREVRASLELVDRALAVLPDGPVSAPPGPLAPGRLGLGQVEAWRGEILTAVIVDRDGKLWRVRPRDPSVQNWIGLALAVEFNQVSDFPLCNKSFNLSYSGSDL
jgi:Ni,Fe-hydrogenase III large subunit/Ni,Fe-hydrogenase III component G